MNLVIKWSPIKLILAGRLVADQFSVSQNGKSVRNSIYRKKSQKRKLDK